MQERRSAMDKNEKTMYVGFWVRRFLCEYIPTVRNLSPNTQKSYRDTLRMLLPQVAEETRKKLEVLMVTDLTDSRILSFLSSLENERNCSVATRNQRLAAIYALAKYISINSPEHVEWCRTIRNVPMKKAPRRQITYLEKSEMDALFAAPD